MQEDTNILKDCDFTLKGGIEHVNRYLESMIKHLKNTGKNCYSWLLTLDIKDLSRMSPKDEGESINEEDEQLVTSCGILAYSIEKGRETGKYETTTEELANVINAFKVLCMMALLEKDNMIKIIDKSYFFDPDGPMETQPTKKFYETFYR